MSQTYSLVVGSDHEIINSTDEHIVLSPDCHLSLFLEGLGTKKIVLTDAVIHRSDGSCDLSGLITEELQFFIENLGVLQSAIKITGATIDTRQFLVVNTEHILLTGKFDLYEAEDTNLIFDALGKLTAISDQIRNQRNVPSMRDYEICFSPLEDTKVDLLSFLISEELVPPEATAIVGLAKQQILSRHNSKLIFHPCVEKYYVYSIFELNLQSQIWIPEMLILKSGTLRIENKILRDDEGLLEMKDSTMIDLLLDVINDMDRYEIRASTTEISAQQITLSVVLAEQIFDDVVTRLFGKPMVRILECQDLSMEKPANLQITLSPPSPRVTGGYALTTLKLGPTTGRQIPMKGVVDLINGSIRASVRPGPETNLGGLILSLSGIEAPMIIGNLNSLNISLFTEFNSLEYSLEVTTPDLNLTSRIKLEAIIINIHRHGAGTSLEMSCSIRVEDPEDGAIESIDLRGTYDPEGWVLISEGPEILSFQSLLLMLEHDQSARLQKLRDFSTLDNFTMKVDLQRVRFELTGQFVVNSCVIKIHYQYIDPEHQLISFGTSQIDEHNALLPLLIRLGLDLYNEHESVDLTSHLKLIVMDF